MMELISVEEKQKRFANLQAVAALAGHQLFETQGGYMLRRWCYSKHVESLSDVAALLQKMTGKAVEQ